MAHGSEPSADRLVLAIDQGTTNTKALLVDSRSGRVLSAGSSPVGVTHPARGCVEQDAADLWSSTLLAVAGCLDAVPGLAPTAVAVTNQRESVVAWSRTSGAPLGPVLGWQDARTAEVCRDLVAAGAGPEVRRRTGLSLDPMFSAPKMRWLLDAAVSAGVDPGDVCLGTVDSWLVWNLTGGAVFATEAGNASRTLLLDLDDLAWSPALIDLFGLPSSALPEVRASDAGYGVTAVGTGVPAGLPVAAVMADSHAALYGHGCTAPGTGKATYGTGSSVMTPCPAPDAAPEGIATTLAWLTDRPTFAREGNVLASGSALDWMATTLGGPADEPGGAFLSRLASQVDDAAGVCFVPAFSGLGAPYWDRGASGVLTGVTAATTRAHLARAALEAVAHQVADVVEQIETGPGPRIGVLHADGGATVSQELMQIQADLLGRPVRVTHVPEASALGVARLAARALDPTTSPSPPALADDAAAAADVSPSRATDRPARRREWRDAVDRSRGRTVEDRTDGGRPS